MTHTLIRFSHGVDLTVRRSWRAMQGTQIARLSPDLPIHAFFAHSIQKPRMAGQPASDESLLRSVAGADASALEFLFAKHSKRVFHFALSITKDPSLAEEIVTDVFLAVWRRAASFKGRSRVSTWLLAIARNKALTSLRQNGPVRAGEELQETVEDTTDNPEVAIQKKQTHTALADSLLQLPPIHRQIIDLVYYHRKSIEEIAQVLDIPVNTVKTRMFYARKRLARLLAAKGIVSSSSLSGLA